MHLWYRRYGKRVLDLIVAAVALILAAPLMLIVGMAVRIRLGSPVFFAQSRPGRHGRIFDLYKFRTMSTARGPDGELLSDAERMTALGRWLRRTSLDELPELYNVLRGEMSLVGPRPLLVEYLDRYTEVQARRHEVRPGITGWAQINGRNRLTWSEKFELDVWYVDNLGPALDLRILILTAWQVLTGRNVSAQGHATMPKFQRPEEEK